MRAGSFREPRRIDAGDRPDPTLREPTDAIVGVVLACVCEGRRRRPVWRACSLRLEAIKELTNGWMVAEAYEAMDERRAIKSLRRVGTV